MGVTTSVGLKVANLLRHQGLASHRNNANRLSGLECVPDPHRAPSLEDYAAAWEAFQGGRAASTGVPGVGQKDKVRRLFWSLAEAVKESQRQFLKNAVTMSLARDARHGRILIRFRAAQLSGATRSGVLGQTKGLRLAGPNALNESTVEILRAFCAQFRGAPMLGPSVESSMTRCIPTSSRSSNSLRWTLPVTSWLLLRT